MEDALDFDSLLATACRVTGLDDLGGTGFAEEEFRHFFLCLTQALRDEADLSTHGRMVARERLLNTLCGRLGLVRDRKLYPGIAEEKIVRPIVTFGLPRSGTTFLHNLLAQDPANRSPATWEIMFPSPPPHRETRFTDPRILQCQLTLERHGWLSDTLLGMHPFGALSSEEDGLIREYAGVGWFAAYWPIPSYSDVAEGASQASAFEVHRKILQSLQHFHRGERWALKDPSHVYRIPQLFETYPDVLAIQTHRDPAKTLPSAASFSRAWRAASVADPARLEGAFNAYIALLGAAADVAIEDRRTPHIAGRVFDCHFVDMIADPIGMVRAIYAHFDIELSAAAIGAMEAHLKIDRHGQGSRHRYSLAEEGLSEAEVDARFDRYLTHYGIVRERRVGDGS